MNSLYIFKVHGWLRKSNTAESVRAQVDLSGPMAPP